jgi:hypothetical protein
MLERIAVAGVSLDISPISSMHAFRCDTRFHIDRLRVVPGFW